jgi:hypothetical protein
LGVDVEILLSLLLAATAIVKCPEPQRLDYGEIDVYRNYIGILSPHPFFPHEPCTPADPEVDVFAMPSHQSRIAQLRRTITGGGCMVVIHSATNDSVTACPRSDLPYGEAVYEESGFIVLETQPGWVRIRLDKGTGWIRWNRGPELHRYEDLVTHSMSSLNPDWDGFLFRAPDGKRWKPTSETDRSVEVVDLERLHGKLWFKVRLLDQSPCAVHEPKTVATGWVPAYDAKGSPQVGSASRGC